MTSDISNSTKAHFGQNFILLQKEALGALAHTGAHLDLSAFSSWEVSTSVGIGPQNYYRVMGRLILLIIDSRIGLVRLIYLTVIFSVKL